MINTWMRAVLAGVGLGAASVLPAAAAGQGQLITNVDHGQCLTVEGDAFTYGKPAVSLPYAVTTRPCTEKHKPWQTWIVDESGHRIHPAAYPDRCLQAVPEDVYTVKMQTLPCGEVEGNAQDFYFAESAFRGDKLLKSGQAVPGHEHRDHVRAYRAQDAGEPINVVSPEGNSTVPSERWKLAPA
ncbi:hypothetical protein ACFQ7O_30450 [Streptomyces sp. NPDC056485]|uniref:hypothetical protein n=1 Tax=Streptomyces sp. NPDC056485 TaxID=3345834 RepID=UPI0036B7628B